MIEVLRVPLSEDLSGFTAVLWQHRIPHRVLEEGQEQLLLVPHNVNAEQIAQLYQMWQQGSDLSGLRVSRPGADRVSGLGRLWLTLTLIALSGIITLIISFDESAQVMRWFTLVDFQIKGNQIYYPGVVTSLMEGQLWRLISPAFMHFNLPHILFNLLWVWVVGRRIEQTLSWKVLLGLFLFSAIASNLAQFWVSGPMFGGMSGFVFALLGFAWLWDRVSPAFRIGLPPALMGFMMFWLVLGFTGVLEGLGLGAIANTAHLVGLLAGLLLVPVVRLFYRR